MKKTLSAFVAALIAVSIGGPAAWSAEEVILPPGATWEYTFTNPTGDPAWNTTTGGWATGAAPFGNATGGGVGGITDFNFNTLWPADGADGDDLWVRTAIDLTGFDPAAINWSLGVDNGYKLYVNGKLVASANAEGYTFRWEYGGTFNAADLVSGVNVIAVALEDHGGATAFDMQIVGTVSAAQVTGSLLPVQTVVNPVSPGAAAHSLVARKDLVVRAILRLAYSANTPPEEIVPQQADAVLCIDEASDGSCAGGTFAVSGMIYPENKLFSVDEIRAAKDSLNFRITGAVADSLTAGTHTFAVDVSPATAGAFVEATFETDAVFNDSDTMRLVLVPVHITNSDGEDTPPERGEFASATAFARAAFPVDEGNVTLQPPLLQISLPTSDGLEVSTGQARYNLALAVGGARDVLRAIAPGAKHHFAAGVVPALIWKGEWKSTLGDAGGYTYRDLKGVVITVDDSVPTNLAHELGHQFGLGDEYCSASKTFPCSGDATNPPPQNGLEGDRTGSFVTSAMGAFDVSPLIAGRTRVFGAPAGAVYGFMASSGALADRWSTPTEYGHLYGQLTHAPPGAQAGALFVQSSADAMLAAVAPREVIRIAGTVAKSGAATLGRFFRATTEAELPPLTGSGYAVEFRDADLNLLGTVGFGLEFKQEILGNAPEVVDIDVTPFSLLTDLPAGTESVSLLQGTTPIATVARSATAPEVSVTGIQVTGGDTVDVSWAGSDIDGDPLTYTVVYSPDGVDLQFVAVESPAQALTFGLFDRSGTAPTPDSFIRVRANDGFNYSETEAPLDFGAGKDTMVLKRYGTRGPNLPGMCSRSGCVRDKTHTVVVKSTAVGATATVEIAITVDAVPDPSCTVNGVGVGGSIVVASGVDVAPGAQSSHNAALRFACAPDAAAIDGDFVLAAGVTLLSGIDLVPGNNQLVRTQTVR